MRRDFAKLISVKREINVKFAVNRDFHFVFVVFDKRYFVINDTTWFSVTFGQPSFPSSVSSTSTKMAEEH